MLGISNRHYAKRRGCSERTIRDRREDGTIAGAVLADGSLDADEADRLLADGITAGPRVDSGLNEARRRKLAAGTALLQDEVLALAASVVRGEEAAPVIKEQLLEIARRLYRVADDAAPQAAGKKAEIAAAAIYEFVWQALYEISGEAADDLGDDEADDEVTPQGRALGPSLGALKSVDIAALKASLEAQRLEIKRALINGEVIAIDDIAQDIGNRLGTVRNRILGAHVKCAPYCETATKAKVRQYLEAEISEAIEELACRWVRPGELTAGRTTTWPNEKRRIAP